MPTGLCPECNSDIRIDPQDELNDIVVCAECDVTLEIVGLDPVQFETVEDVYDEEIYDEDEEEYDY